MTSWPFEHMTDLAKEAEMYETPEWAVEAILDRELMTRRVIDPCVGRGVMALAAARRGYKVHALDKYDWGFNASDTPITYAKGGDFLSFKPDQVIGNGAWTCFMNPPFSLACEFVRHALDNNARKVILFQRFAFWEAAKRRQFWRQVNPTRIYICESRATCWRIDISPEERKRRGGTSTAHAWFVFEPGHPGGPTIGRLEKGDG